MPELDITIGGRAFTVACQAGEEQYLRTAAAMLDAEVAPLKSQAGRMPEARLLLMAGLMLADRMSGVQEKLDAAMMKIELLESRPDPEPVRIEVPVEVRVEVPVVPRALLDRLGAMASEAENLAEQLEARLAEMEDQG